MWETNGPLLCRVLHQREIYFQHFWFLHLLNYKSILQNLRSFLSIVQGRRWWADRQISETHVLEISLHLFWIRVKCCGWGHHYCISLIIGKGAINVLHLIKSCSHFACFIGKKHPKNKKGVCLCIKHINKQRSTNQWQQNAKLFFIHWSELNLTITATVWSFSCSTVGHGSLVIKRSHTVSAQLSRDTHRASNRILRWSLPVTYSSTNSTTPRPGGSVATLTVTTCNKVHHVMQTNGSCTVSASVRQRKGREIK